jgi:signal transduction histidine kinase
MGLTGSPLIACCNAVKEGTAFLYRTCIKPINTDEDSRRREYILNVILSASILMLLALDGMVLYHTILFGVDFPGVSFVEFSVLPLFFILLHQLSRRGYFVLSSYLLIAALFISNSYAAYTWGDDLPIMLLAYAFIICTSGILIGTSFGFIITALTACVLGIVWHLHINGIVIPLQQYPGEDDIVLFVIFYSLIMAISWLSNREIEKSLARARKSEAALKQERDLLETRVVERTEELRKIQFEELERMHRFAKFGKAASGLFHDLLNLLNAISLRTEGNVAEETSLAAAYSTTRQIQQFMHGIQKQLDEKNVSELFFPAEEIEQAIQLIAHKANKENIRIIFPHENNEALTYRGIPFKFHQIVINLLSNAIDAYRSIPKTGTERNAVIVGLKTKDGSFVLTVKDRGCGIPRAAQAMLFKPFFTTKSESGGSGIGLASIKKIIEEDFHGTIGMESTEHVGTTFTVIFPAPMPSSQLHNENQQHKDLP